MPGEFFFVDTNVWVARIIKDHIFHKRAYTKLADLSAKEELFCISGQVMRELIAVCSSSQHLSRPLTWSELQQQIESLLTQTIFLNETEISTRKLVELGARYSVSGKKIHDANIVAVMLANDINRLLTFNVDDFKRFLEIEVIAP